MRVKFPRLIYVRNTQANGDSFMEICDSQFDAAQSGDWEEIAVYELKARQKVRLAVESKEVP